LNTTVSSARVHVEMTADRTTGNVFDIEYSLLL